MLKRVLSVFCILSLAFAFTLPASAATVLEHTLESKLQKQLISSGLNGVVTFKASGDQFENLGALRWTLFKNILSGTAVNVSSSVLHSSREDRETTLQFLYHDEETGTADILNNGERFAVNSTLLSQSGTWYTFPAEMDLLLNADNYAWPAMWKVLMRITNADAEWKSRASSAAAPYYARLGSWLQTYQEINTDGEGTDARLIMHCEIPGDAVKAEMKELMSALYQDTECMSILSEVLTADESRAYLTPGMQSTFFAMLDYIQLNGSVIIDRIYDASGNILMDRITLPFTDSYTFSYLTYSESLSGDSKEYAVSGAYRTGNEQSEDTEYSFLLSMVPAGEEGIWNGSVSAAYPLADRNDSFEVADETAENTVGQFEATFALGIDDAEEVYDAKQDLSSKETDITLTIRPIDGDTSGLHVTSVSASVALSSKSKATAPTNVIGEITITDQETGGTVGLEMNFRTAVRWEPMLIENLPASALRLEEMTPEQLETIKGQWLTQLLSWVNDLTAKAAANH